jgi:hypothetical protein
LEAASADPLLPEALDEELSPVVLAVEPAPFPCVVEFGPATAVVVSDVGARWFDALIVATVTALLLLAAEAELAPPLQAAATKVIKTRIYRYIFPNFCKR